MDDQDRFPLGKPVNRPEPTEVRVPIDGRPNWFLINGQIKYIEPPKQPPTGLP